MSNISSATSGAEGALAQARMQMSMDKLASTTKRPISDKDMAKIDKTAEDFEAVFITEMLKPMFAMVKVDSMFGGGKGEEVFRDFTLNEYGKKLASLGGFGIAKDVKAELIRLQEAQYKPEAA